MTLCAQHLLSQLNRSEGHTDAHTHTHTQTFSTSIEQSGIFNSCHPVPHTVLNNLLEHTSVSVPHYEYYDRMRNEERYIMNNAQPKYRALKSRWHGNPNIEANPCTLLSNAFEL